MPYKKLALELFEITSEQERKNLTLRNFATSAVNKLLMI